MIPWPWGGGGGGTHNRKGRAGESRVLPYLGFGSVALTQEHIMLVGDEAGETD